MRSIIPITLRSKIMTELIATVLLFLALANVAVVKGRGLTDKYYATRCNSINANWQATPGQCVQFPLCPRLLEFAKRPRKSTEDFRLLKKLTCGFHHDKPNICCPDDDIYLPPQRDEHESKYANFPFHFSEIEDEMRSSLAQHEYPRKIRKNHNNWRRRPTSLPSYVFIKDKPISNEFSRLIPRLEDCGNPSSVSTRIVGGKRAQPGEFPYLALLFRIDVDNDEEEHYCAGTIINQHYILTAAHCILANEDTSDRLAFVQVGITDVTERCQHNGQRECLQDRRYEVEDTVIHPKYIYGVRDRSHDIALIRTKNPIEFDEKYVRPVCLPFTKAYGISEDDITRSSPYDFPGDEGSSNGVAVGWGRVSNSGPQSSPHLKSARLPILSRDECQQRYEGQVKISEKQMCGGGEIGTDTCLGDSGGPFLQTYESPGRFSGKMFQTGIISFGPAICGKSGKPSVYTRISSYIDWILDSMYL